MKLDTKQLDQLIDKISTVLPQGYGELREFSEEKFKFVVSGALQSLDLVSREEYDVQTKVLQRTRERLEQLEQRLDLLEKN